MTSKVLQALHDFESFDFTLADLGGEELVAIEQEEILSDSRLPVVVDAVCRSWRSVSDVPNMTAFLLRAASGSDLYVLNDVLDVLLMSTEVLPALADELTVSLRATSLCGELRGEMALEAWTRLALGEWCTTLDLRAALVRTSRSVRSERAPSQYLIRALGAALVEWGDDEVDLEFKELSALEDVAPDVAVELGLHGIALAAQAQSRHDAVAALQDASKWFGVAHEDDHRVDARAFALSVDGVLASSAGTPWGTEDVAQLEDAIDSYLAGYRNEAPHWRQPQVSAVLDWLVLNQRLAASEQETPSDEDLVSTLSDLYRSHQAVRVVRKGDFLPSLLQPPLSRGPAYFRSMLDRLNKWSSNNPDAEIVEGLRQYLEAGADPKAVASWRTPPLSTDSSVTHNCRSNTSGSSGTSSPK